MPSRKSPIATPSNPGHSDTPRKTALPNEGFARLPQVLAVYPVSRSTWLEGVRTGRFPKPVKLGPRTTAWKVSDIRYLIDNLPSNAL